MVVSDSAKDARNVNKSLFMSGEDLVFAKVPFLPQKQQLNTMIFLNNKKKTTNTINTMASALLILKTTHTTFTTLWLF